MRLKCREPHPSERSAGPLPAPVDPDMVDRARRRMVHLGLHFRELGPHLGADAVATATSHEAICKADAASLFAPDRRKCRRIRTTARGAAIARENRITSLRAENSPAILESSDTPRRPDALRSIQFFGFVVG